MMSIGCQAPGYVTTEAPRSLSMSVMDPRTTHASVLGGELSGRVRPPCLPRREQHQGWTASRPGAWPTRASSLSLSTTSCGSRFSSRASATTPCFRRTSVNWTQWSASMSSCDRPPDGSSGPTTVHAVSTMSSTDVIAQMLGGPEALQPRSSRSRTRRPPTRTASWCADTDICRGTSTSISTNVTSRVTGVTCPSSQFEPVELDVPVSDHLSR